MTDIMYTVTVRGRVSSHVIGIYEELFRALGAADEHLKANETDGYHVVDIEIVKLNRQRPEGFDTSICELRFNPETKKVHLL